MNGNLHIIVFEFQYKTHAELKRGSSLFVTILHNHLKGVDIFNEA